MAPNKGHQQPPTAFEGLQQPTEAIKRPRWPRRPMKSQGRSTMANNGQRRPTTAMQAHELTMGGSRRHVSSPRYIFFNVLCHLMLLMFFRTTYDDLAISPQPAQAHDSQRRYAGPRTADAGDPSIIVLWGSEPQRLGTHVGHHWCN